MREMLREFEPQFQMAGVSEKSIGNLKENTKGSEIAEEIRLGFQEGFERMIR
jgi:hypothetical protein